ncbi:TPA: DUF2326 domain-containing protein [Pseudomonas putida]|jgi:hypothetical protein|uniref:Uncharacterized protein n=7 Tax=Pseudomonas TaxID=286 RepID=A0A1B2FBJ7_PSEPU|nr:MULTISPECIES: DUF2326 domain-containing protein [Pseudomonas]ANY89639.1 hypothetical protein IEC33019_4129 [Pseudomonas putida]APO84610.1 hypothetical protein BL240_25490 [Pseudomonas putida]KWW19744.1 hypothetical protein AS889_25760 [Pseudomonas putida]MBA6110377.1 DUF2326 domain-containing protein [Pseudomonas asiatica]MBF8727610.1 DUF2326 domain-containing protein [Pseudomonas putida]
MQLIKLSVFDGSEEIRTIQFKDGINIITNLGETGNQIGKSTSLRALAFCLGGKSEPLWKDPDNNKVNEKVKDYLTKGDVKFELTLRVASINHQITRVLSRKMGSLRESIKIISTIDGVVYKSNAGFTRELPRIFGYTREQPSFNSIRSKFFRTNRTTSNNTLAYLHTYTSDNDYDLIYAYLFDFEFIDSVRQINLIEQQIQLEDNRIRTLLGGLPLANRQEEIQLIDLKISELQIKEDEYDIFESQSYAIAELRESRRSVAALTSRIVKLETKLYYNNKTIERYKNNLVELNVGEITSLYNEAKSLVPNLSKTLEETIEFHNSIMSRKAAYVEEMSAETADELDTLRMSLARLISDEQSKVKDLSRDSHVSGLILVEKQMQDLREARGRLAYVISEVEVSNKRIKDLLTTVDGVKRSIAVHYSDLNSKLKVFNEAYVDITKRLFVTHHNELTVSAGRDGKADFKITNEELNTGDGVPRAAAMAFDMSYVYFVNKFKSRLPAFTAQDYLEVVDEDKLIKLFDFANEKKIQTIAAILNDKLGGFDKKFLEANTILELTKEEKFFKL